MKATGIVRRIDDLGRVVIPKEIRRTQMIRVGDPLEIFVSEDGDVIFKKYSPIGEMAPFAEKYLQALHKVANLSVIIADRDHFIACCGTKADCAKQNCTNVRIGEAYENIVRERNVFAAKKNEEALYPFENADFKICAIAPIVCQGDIEGSIAIVGDSAPSDNDVKLICVAASFFANQMDNT